jgi:hypothetical protein
VYFFFKEIFSCTGEAERTPFPINYSEKLVAQGIELGPLDL